MAYRKSAGGRFFSFDRSERENPRGGIASRALRISLKNLSLGELRSATSGFETVLAYSLAPVFLDFMGFLASALKCCPSI